MLDLDKVEVAKKVEELGQQKAAQYFGVNRSTFRDYLYLNELPTRKIRSEKTNEAKITVGENTVEVTSDIGMEISDPEKIVRERGLDPKDWEFDRMTVNEWDGVNGEKQRQLKVGLKRKVIANLPIVPARIDGPEFKKPKLKNKKSGLYVFLGDQQAPYQDNALIEKVNLFLEEHKPHTIVNIGDTMDLPEISKYKKNPEREASPQDSVDNAYKILKGQRKASENSRIVKLVGNHDVRLRDFSIEWVPEIYGLSQALQSDFVLGPKHLLRLDELQIELIGDNDAYEHGQFNVSKYLAARHGWIATKGSGSSALKTLEHLGYSVVVGHTHRLSLVHKTMHDINGKGKQILTAGESGCLCKVEADGQGFAPSPDWQQGFITAQVYEDGFFKLDTAVYVNGNLLWRDNRY